MKIQKPTTIWYDSQVYTGKAWNNIIISATDHKTFKNVLMNHTIAEWHAHVHFTAMNMGYSGLFVLNQSHIHLTAGNAHKHNKMCNYLRLKEIPPKKIYYWLLLS